MEAAVLLRTEVRVADVKDKEKLYTDSRHIAKLFGVTVRRVQQLTQEGIIETCKFQNGKHTSTRYDLEETVLRYVTYLSDKAYGRSEKKDLKDLMRQKLEADIALKNTQNELYEIKRDIQIGKYISSEEVKLDYIRFLYSFKKFITQIPSRVSGMLMGRLEPVEVRSIERKLMDEANRLLKSFVEAAGIEDDGKGEGKQDSEKQLKKEAGKD